MFKNKDVMRVVAARFISRVGGEAAFFVGIWGKAAFSFHATPTQLAVLMGALSVSSILGACRENTISDLATTTCCVTRAQVLQPMVP